MPVSLPAAVFTAAATSLLALLFWSTTASAAPVGPADTAFTGSGPIRFSRGVVSADCSVELSGRSAATGNRHRIDQVAFKGGFRCSQVKPLNLPWALVSQDDGSGKLLGVQVRINAPLVGGECGPSDITGRWDSKASSLTTSDAPLAGGCIIRQATIRLKPVAKAAD